MVSSSLSATVAVAVLGLGGTAKGFTGRSKNCYGLALRKVHKALQYAYRDRKVKKRIVRRNWIHSINAAVREHGVNYSRF